MSAYSTLYITASVAREAYFKITQQEPSREEIERVLDTCLSPQLYNVIIVGDDAPQDDDIIIHQYIRQIQAQ